MVAITRTQRNKSSFKVQRFLFEGYQVEALPESLEKMFNPVICFVKVLMDLITNRPSSYSTKESGSSVIFIQFYTRGSIEWR